jgi:hypothetical protein
MTVMDELKPTKMADAADPIVQQLRQKEALKVARKIPTGSLDNNGEANYETLNRHVIYKINKGTDHEFVNIGLNVNTFYNNEVSTEDESQ